MLSINNIQNSNSYQKNSSPAFKMAVLRPAKTVQRPMIDVMTKSTSGEFTGRVKKGLIAMIKRMQNNPNHIYFSENGSAIVVDAETKKEYPFKPINNEKKSKLDKFLDKCTELVYPIAALPMHYRQAIDEAERLQAEQIKKANQIKELDKIFDRYGSEDTVSIKN